MTQPDYTFWSDAVGRMRRALGFTPSTPAEADKEMREVKPSPMGKDELDALIRAALRPGAPTPRLPNAPCCDPADAGRLIEVQGSAERQPFSLEQNQSMLEVAHKSCLAIQGLQRQALGL